MPDELTRLGARRAETHPVDDVVEARLEQLQQVRAGRAFAGRGRGEIAAKLSFEQSIHAPQLLLFAQLQAVVRRAHAGLHPVLSGLGLELALRVERTARALQEKVRAFPARELALRSNVTSHISSRKKVRKPYFFSFQLPEDRGQSPSIFRTNSRNIKCAGASAADIRCEGSALHRRSTRSSCRARSARAPPIRGRALAP